jgi:hypothetical protein
MWDVSALAQHPHLRDPEGPLSLLKRLSIRWPPRDASVVARATRIARHPGIWNLNLNLASV